MTGKAAGHEQGDSFEAETCDAYRAIGYGVQRNVQLGGQQVDLLATRAVPGLGTLRVAIECKQRSAASIGNEIAQDFVRAYSHLILAGLVDRAVLVTNVPLTAAARQVVESHQTLDARTLEEIRGEAIDPTEALRQFVHSYERDDRVRDFIPVRLRFLDSTEGPRTADALEAIKDRIGGIRRQNLAIFADFGGGKTTLLERVKYEWARRFLTTRQGLVPVYARLQDFGRFPNLDEYAVWVMRQEFGVEVSAGTFWNLAEAGRFLLLLDGFDEVAGRVDQSERTRLFLSLGPLLSSHSPAILTSRPGYFASLAEYRSLARIVRGEPSKTMPRPPGEDHRPASEDLAEIVMARHLSSRESRRVEAPYLEPCELAPLTSEMILRHLEHYDAAFEHEIGESARSVYALLAKVYDLPDLMQRPILLDMVIETVLSGRLDLRSADSISPATLYEAYTTAKLGIDWDRTAERRNCLTVSQRRDFAEGAAALMAHRRVLTLGSADVLQLVDSVKLSQGQIQREISREQILSDLRTCSFLTVESTGSLRFIHKSFFEFFLARSLAPRLLDGSRDEHGLIDGSDVNQETLLFLADMVWTALLPVGGLRTLRRLIRGSLSDRRRSVLVASALLSRSTLQMFDVQDTDLPPLSASSIDLRGCTWRGIRAVGLRTKTLRVETESKLESLSLHEADVDSLGVGRSSLEGTVERSSFGNVELVGARVRLACNDLRVSKLKAESSSSRLEMSTSRLGSVLLYKGEHVLTGSFALDEFRLQQTVVHVGLEVDSDPPWSAKRALAEGTAQRSNAALGRVSLKSCVAVLDGVASTAGFFAENSVLLLCDSLTATAVLSNSTLRSCVVISPPEVAGGLTFDSVEHSILIGVPVREAFSHSGCAGIVSLHPVSTTARRRPDLPGGRRDDPLTSVTQERGGGASLVKVGYQHQAVDHLREISESIGEFLLTALAAGSFDGWSSAISARLASILRPSDVASLETLIDEKLPFSSR